LFLKVNYVSTGVDITASPWSFFSEGDHGRKRKEGMVLATLGPLIRKAVPMASWRLLLTSHCHVVTPRYKGGLESIFILMMEAVNKDYNWGQQ
jgi:hypothetical protein